MPVLTAARGAKEPEPVIDPGHDLVDGHRAEPDRGQLKGQRDTVKPTAQPGHGRLVDGGEREAGHHRLGPVDEQAHGVGHRIRVVGGRVERRDEQRLLSHHIQRLPAGGQDAQSRRRAQQHLAEQRAPIDQVLAGVQDQQQVPVRQVVGEQVERIAGALVRHAESGGHRAGKQLSVPQGGQFDQPDPVLEGAPRRRAHVQRQPGLADTADTAQGHQPVPAECVPYPFQVPGPADEPGDVRRQVAGSAV
jgi:hypothetical protein